MKEPQLSTNKDLIDLIETIPINDRSHTYFTSERSYYITEDRIEKTVLFSFSLDSIELLQQFSVRDVLLNEKQIFDLTRLFVLRDGLLIDKKADLVSRKIANEDQSTQGVLSGRYKINMVISDLRIGDIIIYENKITDIYTTNDFLEKKYVYSTDSFPVNLWKAKKYRISIENKRNSDLILSERFFNENLSKSLLQGGKKKILPNESTLIEYSDITFSVKRNEFVPRMELVTSKTWEEVSSDIYCLYEPLYKKSEKEVVALFETLKGGNSDIETTIRTCIEYVQNEIFYLFDTDIMHGHVPQQLSQTIQSKLGDCKAKSMLLVKLLSLLGIKTEVVLVNYSNDILLLNEHPSPFVFNHAIVRYELGTNEYFVDTTTTGQYGLPDYRTEPIFHHYLPLRQGASLCKKNLRKIYPNEFNLDEKMSVTTKGEKIYIKSVKVYMREYADNIRRVFVNTLDKDLIDNTNQYTKKTLCLDSSDKDITFYNEKYHITDDDKNKNICTVEYSAEIEGVFRTKPKVLRLYQSIAINSESVFDLIEIIPNPVVLPERRKIDVKTSFFIDGKQAYTQKNFVTDNQFFSFSNIRSRSFKGASVISTFVPKNFADMSKAEFEVYEKDINTINDSNYGIGIVSLASIGRLIYLILFLVYIIGLLFK